MNEVVINDVLVSYEIIDTARRGKNKIVKLYNKYDECITTKRVSGWDNASHLDLLKRAVRHMTQHDLIRMGLVSALHVSLPKRDVEYESIN